MAPYWPIRGLLLSTGEDLPEQNSSALARMIVVNVPNRAKDLDRGERCKRFRPRYQGVTADYVAHVIEERLAVGFADRVATLQRQYYSPIAGMQNDARIAGNFAMLAAAFEAFARYLGPAWPDWKRETATFVNEDLVAIRDQMLGTVVGHQASEIFLDVLRTLLEYERVQIDGCGPFREAKFVPTIGKRSTAAASKPNRNGPRVSTRRENMPIEISTELALAEVQSLLREQCRTPLSVSTQALVDQLAQDGHLVDQRGRPLTTPQAGVRTVQRRIVGAVHRCILVMPETLGLRNRP